MDIFACLMPFPLTSVRSVISSCLRWVRHRAEWLHHHPRLAQRVPPQQELRVAADGAHPVPHHSGVWRVRDRGKRRRLKKVTLLVSVCLSLSAEIVARRRASPSPVVSKIVQCLPSGVQIRLRGGAQRLEFGLEAPREVLRRGEARGHHLPAQQHEDRVQVGQHRLQEGLQGSLLLWWAVKVETVRRERPVYFSRRSKRRLIPFGGACSDFYTKQCVSNFLTL